MESVFILLGFLCFISLGVICLFNRYRFKTYASKDPFFQRPAMAREASMSLVLESMNHDEHAHLLFKLYCQKEYKQQEALLQNLCRCGQVKHKDEKLYYGDVLLVDHMKKR
ncbi:MAG: hypothetical protein VW378_06700 [bacterium]